MIISVLIATAGVLMIALVMVIVYWRWWRPSHTIYKLDQQCTTRVSQPQYPPTVFIVADGNLEDIRRLCHQLHDYRIDPIYYHFVENDRHNGPGQLGVPAWTEKRFTESDMVLFVCNQGFQNVWENKEGINRLNPYTLIISTSKQLFYGRQEFSKYAVILLEEYDHCSDYIPELLKTNAKHFLVNDQEALARYILEVPTHIPPHQS